MEIHTKFELNDILVEKELKEDNSVKGGRIKFITIEISAKATEISYCIDVQRNISSREEKLMKIDLPQKKEVTMFMLLAKVFTLAFFLF